MRTAIPDPPGAVNCRIAVLVVILGVLGIGGEALGQPRAEGRPAALVGRVFHRNNLADIHGQAHVEVRVRLDETDSTTVTDRTGTFRLPLPDSPLFQADEMVTLSVFDPGWRIGHPFDGEVRIPRAPGELVMVELVPIGSPRFWGNLRFEKLIVDLGLLALHGTSQVDISRATREWAERYGLDTERAQQEVRGWVAWVLAENQSARRQGLAELYRERFDQAAQHFESAAREEIAELAELARQAERLRQQKLELQRRAVTDLLLKADAHISNDDPGAAIAACQHALSIVQREELPREWATVQSKLGAALFKDGLGSSGDQGMRLQVQAAAAHREALEVFTREEQPLLWGKAQRNLAAALAELAFAKPDEYGFELLNEAGKAYAGALQVFSREGHPHAWATTQARLGNVMFHIGQHTTPESVVTALDASEKAYRRALEVFRQDDPQWVYAQHNLGRTLVTWAMLERGEPGHRLLAEAAAAYRQAVDGRSHEETPQQWVVSITDLGYVLQEQGLRLPGEKGEKLLAEAVALHRRVPEVLPREQMPKDWANAQNTLGISLTAQGNRLGGEEGKRLLGEAVAVFESALQVCTREKMPDFWWVIRENHGNALWYLERYQEAAAALREMVSEREDFRTGVLMILRLDHDYMHNHQACVDYANWWLSRNPDDWGVRLLLMEALFATRRYSECVQLSRDLNAILKVSAETRIIQRGYEIAGLLAQSKEEEALALLDRLAEALLAQPTDFELRKSFDGTMHFLHQTPDVPFQEGLIALFTALRAANRDALIEGLLRARRAISTAWPTV